MTNIAEILKECPRGTKLYSPICGECELDCIVSYYHNDEYEIRCIVEKNCNINFDEFGRYEYDGGECLLFPSKENRDWSTLKYSKFKKGDFLRHGDYVCLFWGLDRHNAIESLAFYNTRVERCRLCEKPQIGIGYIDDNDTKIATEKDKAMLLKKIYENGYVWDADKLELKKKMHAFKPFDKVLVRANKDCKWAPRFFAIMKDDVYCDTNGSWAKYCIPYEGNEHLLGTTNEPECVS